MINNTAKVVNISFQTKTLRKVQTRCTQVEDKQQSDMSMQGFMKSRVSTKLMYQLLNIFKGQPKNLQQIMKASNINIQNDSQATQSSQQQFTEQKQGDKSQLQTIIISPTNQQQTFENTQSIIDDQGISKTNTIYIPKDEPDSIDQQQNDRFRRQGKKNLSAFSPISKGKVHKNDLKESQSKFYLIPSQYQPNLIFLLTHFLKFKIFNKKSNQNTLGKSTITKRPKTTSKNTLFNKQQNFTSPQNKPQNKPTTANSNSRTTINYKKIPTLSSDLAEDFNQHLQKIMLMQKQLQKKSKKIIFLQNQLSACTQTIKDKNNQIHQLQQKQTTLKKKFTYEVDKIMKTKVMTDINEIFLSNLNQQNNYGKSIFQINGKKYVKTDQLSSFNQSTFMTTPKMSIFSRTNQSYFRSNDNKHQGQTLKKCQSMALIRKSKGANKKLQLIKLTKHIQSLVKQVQKFQKQKLQMFDRLAQNNSKIQKRIEKIQLQIEQKHVDIKRFTEEMQKLKQF